MVKQVRSIDGFVVRRNSSSLNTPEVKLDSVVTNTSGQSRPRKASTRPTINDLDYMSGKAASANKQVKKTNHGKIDNEQQLLSDIENSLNQIDDITPPEGEDNERRRRRAKRRAEKKALKHKKQISKGKIIKRIVIVLILIVLGVIGYLAVKALLAGGKMFNGNPLGMLTTKTRLAEDENGRTNILIFGTSGYSMDEGAWDGAMLTDSIMVVSLDQDNYDAYMMSLPRDLYVKHSDCPVLGTNAGKLNEVFYCTYGVDHDEKAGAESLMAKAGEILDLDIQYYIHADWTALVQAVDAVGGVDITIESDDPRGIYDSGTGIKYANGEVAHLDGQKALAEKNQQKILAALQQKALSIGTLLNPVSVNNLIDSMGDNLVTSFDASHVQTLIDIASNLKADSIKQLPFVGRDDGGPDLIASYSPNGTYAGEAPVAGVYDYADIQAYVAQNLSSDPVVREGAVIDVLNGSDQAGLAAEKADELESDGYMIGEIANAPSVVADKVIVYQLNSDMSETAKALSDDLGVNVVSGSLAGYVTDADFVVVYGEGSADSTTQQY